jgi:hypothetical protein
LNGLRASDRGFPHYKNVIEASDSGASPAFKLSLITTHTDRFGPREAVSSGWRFRQPMMRVQTMSNQLFASILAAALSLASAASFAAPADNEAETRDQASPAKVQVEQGKTRYWSHPRLGMVKVDAAGRMLTTRSAAGDAARPAAPSGHPSTRTP